MRFRPSRLRWRSSGESPDRPRRGNRHHRWLLALLAAALSSAPETALATTYFVRTDGGGAGQCTGLADAAYPGSGSAQPCAWNHPFQALPPGGAPRIAGGDTLWIRPGSYRMGYGASGAESCDADGSFDCTMLAIPSGADPASPDEDPRRVVGFGLRRPARALGRGAALVARRSRRLEPRRARLPRAHRPLGVHRVPQRLGSPLPELLGAVRPRHGAVRRLGVDRSPRRRLERRPPLRPLDSRIGHRRRSRRTPCRLDRRAGAHRRQRRRRLGWRPRWTLVEQRRPRLPEARGGVERLRRDLALRADPARHLLGAGGGRLRRRHRSGEQRRELVVRGLLGAPQHLGRHRSALPRAPLDGRSPPRDRRGQRGQPAQDGRPGDDRQHPAGRQLRLLLRHLAADVGGRPLPRLRRRSRPRAVSKRRSDGRQLDARRAGRLPGGDRLP